MVVAGVVAAAVVGAAFLSCARERPTAPRGTPPAPTTLHWVSTAVIYGNSPGKKDHSLVFILATWCGWCKKLKTETLADTTVVRMLNESFNIAQIDPDSDSLVVYKDSVVTCKQLARSIYGVRGYPTIIAIDRMGEELGAISGYRDPAPFVDVLELILEQWPTPGDPATVTSVAPDTLLRHDGIVRIGRSAGASDWMRRI